MCPASVAKKSFRVLMVLLGTTVALESAQAQQDRQVRGWVQGLAAGDSAIVRLTGPTTLECSTRPGGAWTAEGAKPGVYQAVPASPGYRFDPPSRSAKVGNSNVNAVNFRAVPTVAPVPLPADDQPTTGFVIRGRIRGLAASDRLVIRAAGPIEAQTMTGPGGKYELGGLMPGTYRLFVEDGRYRLQPSERNVQVEARDRHDILFSAKLVRDTRPQTATKPEPVARFSVSGRVDGLKALLHGCARASVTALGPQTVKVRTLKSEHEFDCGTFQLAGLTPGRYQIKVWVPANAMQVWTVTPPVRTIDLTQDVSGLLFEAKVDDRSTRRKRRSR